ncbi:8-oxo-dGTP pyrophosphatase MutT, NUDIX family [Chishuiella changwenlii]|uniref:8-oxo-dGTP diphosphatase n=1 Tax=Chishuiella changwenlii TaxID=1434701 RepID=A0A1M6T5E7_9FLAO|nr:NUDIX domain-containing protein [Chishuiella changwenlii]GGE94914.1 DNA mismatch repair protein MutT [Chishuiella changwenlii]SHK52119.1 8-oxo-dGTP pyrophosphatase MutT, NUDIX family [Chishuiella changwenlii]
MKNLYLANALVTDNEGRMLAVRKNKSIYFQMVGGKIDGAEKPIQALEREFKEEINININLHKVSFLGTYTTNAVNEENTLVNATIFHVHLNSINTIKIDAEIEEIAWITKEDYKDYQFAHLLREFSLPIWLKMKF